MRSVLLEEGSRFRQIPRVEAIRKPAVDRLKKLNCRPTPALRLPNSGKAGGGPKFNTPSLLSQCGCSRRTTPGEVAEDSLASP